MTAYEGGRKREYLVQHRLEDYGWVTVSRSAGSHGPADLVMVHPEHGLALIQVGAEGKTIGPEARKRFLHLAELCGALPLVATTVPSVGVRYRLCTPTPAQSWPTFDPVLGLDPRLR